MFIKASDFDSKFRPIKLDQPQERIRVVVAQP